VMNPKMSSIKITGDLPIKVVQLPSATPVKLDVVSESVVLRIIFLSRISREKNLNVALSILRSVKENVVFDIYGPTENMSYWNECQVLISELPPNVKAKYCGNVLPGNVLEIFGNYDLFLFPTGGEAYGNVIAESLTAGTPVLLSTETPWRDLEADGLGWDIDLSNLDAFVSVIESVALQSQSQRQQVRTAVRARARDRLLNHDVLESNRRLFNITAND
jgi:glycosyltransferase involved in cell wall biosynthesis